MLDLSNIPNQQENVKVFYATGTTAWQTWQRPRGCNFIWMMCIGGGAGGGAGGIGTGGYGAGSGAVTKAIFPASVLPDLLYIQPGPGGIGGIPNTGIGGSGNRSFVSITPSSAVAMNLVCISGTAGATGGNTGGASGGGETAATTTVAGLLSLGTFSSTAGITSVSILTYTPFTTNITCPGVNGNLGASNPGSNIAAVNLGVFRTPNIPGGAIGTGQKGGDGVFSWKPFYSLGGGGAAGTTSGTGGSGGNGAYGSGGSGGGGGSVAGGAGGKGGDGLVIIAAF